MRRFGQVVGPRGFEFRMRSESPANPHRFDACVGSGAHIDIGITCVQRLSGRHFGRGEDLAHYGRIGFYRDAFPLPEDGGKRHLGKEMLHQRHGAFVVFVAGYGQQDALLAKGSQEGFDAGVGTGVFPEVFPILGDEFGTQGGGSLRGGLSGRQSAFDEFVDAVTHYSLNIFSEIPFYELSLYIRYLQMFSFDLNTHEISLF